MKTGPYVRCRAAVGFNCRLRKIPTERCCFRKKLDKAVTAIETAYLSSAALSIETISDKVLKAAQRLTGSRYGFVAYLDPATGWMISTTMTRDVWKKCRVKNKSNIFKKFGGLWGWVLKHKKHILTNNAPADPRSGGAPEGHIKIEKFLAAPAVFNKKLIGMVALANSRRNYADEDLAAAKKLARVYAIIIQRKFAEDRLKESEEILRRFFDATTDAVFIKDIHSRYIKVNKACADILLLKPEEVPGKTDAEVFPPEVADEVSKHDREVLRTGKTLVLNYERILASGRYYFNTIKTPLRNNRDEITGIIGVARDITKIKKMESELALARALEAVSLKTRPMAHDFNNALAAINGYATLIDDDLDAENPIKPEIAMIIRGVKRAAKITARLQKYARNPKITGSKPDKDPYTYTV